MKRILGCLALCCLPVYCGSLLTVDAGLGSQTCAETNATSASCMLSAGPTGGSASGLLGAITPGFQGFGPPYVQYGFNGSLSTYKSLQSADNAMLAFTASLTLPSNWGDVTVYALDNFTDDSSSTIHENLSICHENIAEYSCVINHAPGTPLTITESDEFSSVLPGESAQWQFTVLFMGTAVPEPHCSAALILALTLLVTQRFVRRRGSRAPTA